MNSVIPTPESADTSEEDNTSVSQSKFYLAAWRWHFFAGLYIAPFMLILAVSGLMMLSIYALNGRDGERTTIAPQEEALAVSAQAEAAIAAVPDGTLVQYIAPLATDKAALFAMKMPDETLVVAIDPYTGSVVNQTSRENSWYSFFNDLHGSLLIGTTGDRLLEIAASLTMVLLATGIYLWWPRNKSLASALIPNVTLKGRNLWKSLHVSIGVWISALMFVFLLIGLSWAGIWGGKLVQAWNTFPAEKWEAPQSDVTHESMNHGDIKQVPWPLEQTPMPESGSDAGNTALSDGAVNIDSVSSFARDLGFDQRFQLNLPNDETGVWTVSRDSMSSDSTEATTDRTVHIDQYSGNVLADIGFVDYSIFGKAMAAGVGFHMGTLGLWNVALNTLFCLSVIFLSVSGVVMWWLRRPAKAGRLVAPPMPTNMPLWRGATLIGLAVSLFFPLAGLALLAVLTLDYLLLSRVPVLKKALS